MAEDLEIIISAIDQASQVFQNIISSAMDLGNEVSSSVETASTDFDEMGSSAEDAAGSVDDVGNAMGGLDGSSTSDAAGGMGELGDAANDADNAVENLSNDLSIINAGMLLQTAEQISGIAGNAEGMAQEMNEAAITVGQLATQTGIAEPKLVDMINEISNATFPNEEAMMYVKSLDQIGVSSENLGKSATDLDKINDAFGMGADRVNSLGQELSVLGVDMNDVSSSFNALAYANANTVGGMDNYYNFLRKYDAQFKELGYNVDQASVIIAGATQKFGGGRAALTGLSDALKESNGDTRKLEEALGLTAGSIDNATQLTGKYEGQLQQMANEEAEHKTILDQVGAAVEDLKLKYSGVISPLSSFVGIIGEVGSFGMQVQGLKNLANTSKQAFTWISQLNIAQKTMNALQGISNVITAALAGSEATLGMAYAGVTAEEVGAAAAHASGAASIGLEGVAATEAGGAFAFLGAMELTALWPIALIVAAIVALGAAFYGLGQYFGWWTDFGSMLDSIKSGVERLWNAFINHPDVQAVIKNIQTAWNNFTKTLGDVISKVLEFFGIHQGGEFDAIGAIISGVGSAWETLKSIVSPIIGIFRNVDGAIQTVNSKFPIFSTIITTVLGPIGALYNMLRTIVCILLGCSPGIVPALETTQQVFDTVWNAIVTVVTTYVNTILAIFQPLIDIIQQIATLLSGPLNAAWNLILTVISIISSNVTLLINNFIAFLNGQISLSQLLASNWQIISNMFNTVFTLIFGAITKWANNMVNTAKKMATNLLNRIVNGIKNLPNRVKTIITHVLTNIIKGMTQWITNGAKKAGEFVTKTVNGMKNLPKNVGTKITATANTIKDKAVSWAKKGVEGAKKLVKDTVDKVSDLPDKIGTEFNKIPNIITNAINEMINRAKKIKDLPATVLKLLGIASPGTIQRAVVKEFGDTVTRVNNTAKSAFNAAKNVASNLKQGFGAVNLDENLNAEYINGINNTNEVHTIDEQTLEIKVKHEHDYNFKGLPDTISAKEVADMINEANQNDSWIKKLTNNPRFQQFDLKEKQKITRHNKRVTGV